MDEQVRIYNKENKTNSSKIDNRGDVKEHLVEIDFAKALGIILVVYGHFFIEFSSKTAPSFAVARVIYLFHMPLFFAITGLPNGIWGKRAVLNHKRDVKKLFVPYLIWSVIYLIAIVFVRGVIPGKMDKLPGILSERFCAFWTGRGIAPIWFLMALFLGKLAYELLRVAISFDKRKNRVLILVLLAIICVFSKPLFDSLQQCIGTSIASNQGMVYRYLIITIFRIPLTVFFITFGECIGRNWNTLRTLGSGVEGTSNCGRKSVRSGTIRKWLMLLITAACLVTLILLEQAFKLKYNFHTFEIPNMPLFLLTGSVGTLMVLAICIAISNIKWAQVLKPIGKRSFDIMVLHYPPMPIMTVIMLAEKSLQLPKIYVINTAVTITICMAISKYILDNISRIIVNMKDITKKS